MLPNSIQTLTRVARLVLGLVLYLQTLQAPQSQMTLHSCHKSFELVAGKAHGMVEPVCSRYTDMELHLPRASVFSLVNWTGLNPVPSLLL